MPPIVKPVSAATMPNKSTIVTAVIVFETADHRPTVEQPGVVIH
jgi:hypothetical protein